MHVNVGKFEAGVLTRQVTRKLIQVAEPLGFHDPVHGYIEVPDDFRSDGMSIRILRQVALIGALLSALASVLAWGWLDQLAWYIAQGALVLYALVVGYGLQAAILHDYLYSVGRFTRRQSDAIYYRALRGTGVARWRAGICWSGVRIGGASHYTKTPAWRKAGIAA